MADKNQAVRKVPMRECTGCRTSRPKKELVRVIRTEDGQIMIDLTGKQNGRGAYICRDPKCLALAEKSKALERSLKTAIGPDVYAALREELRTDE